MKIDHFKLERFFAQYEFQAPYLLCCSDCESFKVEDLFQSDPNAEKDFKGLWLGYTETLGNPRLREEIARLYGHTPPGNIMVFSGAEEGIFIFMNAVLDPGHHIIVQFPCYQSLIEVARAIGCRVTPWDMDPGNNWELNIDFLEKSITQETKAIVVNFPHNPTGYIPTQKNFQRIVEIARQANIYLFSDEVYRMLEYREEDRLPAGCDVYEKGVSLGVMSKSLGLAGLRIGWMATRDQALFEAVAAFKDYTTICSSAPSEYLATLALKNKEFILNRNLDIIKTNLGYLESFFKRYPGRFDWVKPKAGPLVFPRLTFTRDAEVFCLDLLEKKGVLLLPGNRLNYQDHYVRVGLGRKNMPEALEKLGEYLSEKIN